MLHVRTDEGVEGVCRVGDARYTTMRKEELEQLRILTPAPLSPTQPTNAGSLVSWKR